MKSLSVLFISLFSLSAISQTSYISGHVENGQPGDLILVRYDSSPLSAINNDQAEVYASLDSELNFLLQWEAADCPRLTMTVGDKYLFYGVQFCAGDSVHIEVGEDDLTFSGAGAERLSFFLNRNIMLGEYHHNAPNPSELTPQEYYNQIWIERMVDMQYFEDKLAPENQTPELREAYAQEAMYNYAVHASQYAWRNTSSELNVYTSATKNQVMADVIFNNPDALNNSSYIHFLREWPYGVWSYHFNKIDRSDSLTRHNFGYYTYRDSVAQFYFTGESYTYALYYIISEKIESLEYSKGKPYFKRLVAETRAFMNDRMVLLKNIELAANLEAMFRMATYEPELAADFVAYNEKGEEVHLSDLRGKVVYVDFWATTCAPCVAEIPRSIALQDTFKNDDVVFLYVALQSNVDFVKNYLQQKEFTGTHWFAPAGFNSDPAVKYHISGIPRYLVIDREGYLLSGDAPRPTFGPEALIREALER